MPIAAITETASVQKSRPEINRLLDGLARVMEPGQVRRWLKAPNPAFDGSTPLQAAQC